MRAPFTLMPMSGDNPSDVMRTFDGQGEALRAEAPDARSALMRRSLRPHIGGHSTYEAIDPESLCLGMEEAAHVTQSLGPDRVLEAMSSPRVSDRLAMQQHLMETLLPSAAPSGPVFQPTAGPAFSR